MALVLYDRVQQTGTANTTVSFTLSGSVTGYQSFSVVGNGNTTYYGATDGSGNWEVGIGTYATGGTLTRTTILSSSNSGSAVTFSGTVNVFVTYPSSQSVYEDASGNVSPLGTIASGTWQGTTIGVAYGGTGVTASSGASSVVLRDASQNINFNNYVAGYAATTAAAGTTILTVASARNQILIGSTTQTFQLPNATTLALGQSFLFLNNSSGVLTVKDNASTTIDTIPSGAVVQIGATSISTSAGSWSAYSFLPGSYDFNNTTATFNNAAISSAVWNGTTIASGYGGTGLTTFSAANNAIYSTSSSALAAGTLPIAAGGTSATTANAAFNALAPSQTSNSGKYLTTNGTDTSWGSLGNAYTKTSFTATASQTTFTVTYTVGLIEVYVNGVLLNGADYTASNGTSVVLAVGCNSGDIVETIAFSSFSVASTVSSFSGGSTGLTPSSAATGNVTLAGTLAVANGGTGVTTSTGSGAVVLGTSPTLTTPTIDKINTSVTNTSLGAGNASIMKNRIINGAMGISQRTAVNTNVAVTTTASGTFGPDRFWGYTGTASLWNISQVTTSAYDFPYACRLQRIAGQTSTSAIYCGQTIETNNCINLAGQSVTLSFYATAGANYSGGAATAQVLTGTAADQGTSSLNNGAWTALALPINTAFTPTTTRTLFTFTGTIGSTVQEIAFRFNWSGAGTAGANDYIDITGVQLEVGSSATGFEYRQYGQELALCQRYFQKTNADMYGSTANVGYLTWQFKVSMRASPTVAYVSGTLGTAQNTCVDWTDLYNNGYPYLKTGSTASAEL
jgi:hypothetical protein